MNQLLIRPGGAVLAVALVAGCAATPAQLAMDYRRSFNSALQTLHDLHLQGKVSSTTEQQLLPLIQAGSAALDQMDADAASGDQAGYEAALTALQAAIAQLNAATNTTPPASSQPSTSH